jgi:hypothetical protein
MCAMKSLDIALFLSLLAVLAQPGCRFRAPAEPRSAAELTLCSADEIAVDGAQGCDVVLEPYPRYDDQDALAFNDLPVSLFFFPQTPPDGTEVLRPIRARAVMGFDRGSCRDAGIAGLKSLQRLAVRNDADAVVNIRATWDGEPLGDELSFGCRRLGDRYALIWEGALARVPAAPAPDPSASDGGAEPDPPEPVDMGEETAAKLRKLQNLYYQGLITREELLERRQEILNAL